MPTTRAIKQMTGLALAAAAAAAAGGVAATQNSAQAVSAQAHEGVCATTPGPGYRDAVPPILPSIPCSELAGVRRAEKQAGQAYRYRLPNSARYSDVEMSFYAHPGRPGS